MQPAPIRPGAPLPQVLPRPIAANPPQPAAMPPKAPETSYSAIAKAMAVAGLTLETMPEAMRKTLSCTAKIADIDVYKNNGKMCCQMTVERKITVPGRTDPISVTETLQTSVEFPDPPVASALTTCKEILTMGLQVYDQRLQAGLADPKIGAEVAKEEGIRFTLSYNNEGKLESAELYETAKPDAKGVVTFVRVAQPAAPVVLTHAQKAASLQTPSKYEHAFREKFQKAIDIIAHMKLPPMGKQAKTHVDLERHLLSGTTPPKNINEFLVVAEHDASVCITLVSNSLHKLMNDALFTAGDGLQAITELRRRHDHYMQLESRVNLAQPQTQIERDAAKIAFTTQVTACLACFCGKQTDTARNLKNVMEDLQFFTTPALKGTVGSPENQAARSKNLEYLKNQQKAHLENFAKIEAWLMNGAKAPMPALVPDSAPSVEIEQGLIGHKPFKPNSATAAATPAAASAQAPKRQVTNCTIIPSKPSGNCLYEAIITSCEQMGIERPKNINTVADLRREAAAYCRTALQGTDKADMSAALTASINEYNNDLAKHYTANRQSLEAMRKKGTPAEQASAQARLIELTNEYERTKITFDDSWNEDRSVRQEAYEAYITRIERDGFWGSAAETYALSNVLNINIYKLDAAVQHSLQEAAQVGTPFPMRAASVRTIYLDYQNRDHWNAVIPRK